MIKDQNGKVYVRFDQPIPKYVKIGNKEYVCDVRYGVSMLLVDESEVPALLNYVQVCCGGHQKHIFTLPSQEAVNVYLTGNR